MTHPAEVNEHLAFAHAKCQRLIEAAELRGDQAGADAWLVALRSIETTEKAMRDAREKQTWTRKPPPAGENELTSLVRTILVITKHGPGGTGAAGPCDPGCLKCRAEAAIERSPRSLVECEHGTRGCAGRGEKHACT